MAELKDLLQTADWKKEKHVPVIEAPEKINKGVFFNIKVSIGKEAAHPNETQHHIRWVEIYFHPEGEKFPYQIARFEFSAHGESLLGPNTSSIYTHPEAVLVFKTDKAGAILACAYCNIHGLWQSSKNITIDGVME